MTTAIKPSKVRTMDMKLEVIVIPVSDVERSKQFYGSLRWRLDERVPACSAIHPIPVALA